MSAPQDTSSDDAADQPRLIKRYTNRKLYDTTSSAYVTLDDLAEMIRGGEDVRVIDNRSKEDLTSVTLAQIIFEQQKSRRRAMPLSALRTIIQGPAELFQKLSQPVTQFKDEAAKQVGKLKRKEDEEDIGDKEDKGDKASSETSVLSDSDAVIAAIERLQTNLETMQQKLDDQVQDAVSALHHVPDLQREIDEIKGRLDSLETIAAQLAGAVGLSPEQLLESMENQG